MQWVRLAVMANADNIVRNDQIFILSYLSFVFKIPSTNGTRIRLFPQKRLPHKGGKAGDAKESQNAINMYSPTFGFKLLPPFFGLMEPANFARFRCAAGH